MIGTENLHSLSSIRRMNRSFILRSRSILTTKGRQRKFRQRRWQTLLQQQSSREKRKARSVISPQFRGSKKKDCSRRKPFQPYGYLANARPGVTAVTMPVVAMK